MFDWRDFITLADRLAADGNDAGNRSAISRAYYGAFNVARRYVSVRCPDVDVSERVPNIHTSVWEGLQRPQRKRLEREAGVNGDRLKGYRIQADYRAPNPNAQLVRESLRVARLVCEKLDKPVPPAPPAAPAPESPAAPAGGSTPTGSGTPSATGSRSKAPTPPVDLVALQERVEADKLTAKAPPLAEEPPEEE